MIIGVDGGALCAESAGFLGTSVFTDSLLQALVKYDRKNRYRIYTFCKLKNEDARFEYTRIRPTAGFMKIGITKHELLAPSDIFLGLNQSLPLTRTKKITFCHGLSHHFYPDLYPTLYSKLQRQLDDMIKHADCLITSSIKVTQELQTLYPYFKKISTIPFGVPTDFLTTAHAARQNYFLYVGSNEPKKRLDLIISTFSSLTAKKKYQDYKLYLVGQHQKYKNIKGVKILPTVSRSDLKKLYQQARALLTTSYYESFNFPILEALSQNCPVIAMSGAVIPELKKYVEVAENDKEFLNLLTRAAEKKIHYNYSREIKTEFSFKQFVEKLTDIYEIICSDIDQK